jgi:hypothetical protein
VSLHSLIGGSRNRLFDFRGLLYTHDDLRVVWT